MSPGDLSKLLKLGKTQTGAWIQPLGKPTSEACLLFSVLAIQKKMR
jgi:hypothetical protein